LTGDYTPWSAIVGRSLRKLFICFSFRLFGKTYDQLEPLNPDVLSWSQNSAIRRDSMTALPEGRSMKYREFTSDLQDEGWRLKSQKGSHQQWVHPTKPGKVTVAGHPNDDIPPGLLNSMRKQAGMK
jgi:predicted RNA binding protein YcfA (HicA-like mRNA interferase family)